MRRLLIAMCLVAAGCTFIVGDPDPRDTNGGGGGGGLPDLSVVPCANVQVDPHNCGSCGHDCGQLPNVDPTKVGCTVGVCDLRGACLPGHADCSGGYIDGCETDLTTADHCGSCTAQCAGQTPLCARDALGNFLCAGTCSGATPTQCGSSCVDTANDAQHCGSCTHACAAGANQVAVCQNGSCSTSCSSGFHSCGGVCKDDTSLQSCGNACSACPSPPANAVEVCDVFAGCSFKCNAGFSPGLGNCVPNMTMMDMARSDMASNLGPCDCRGLAGPNQCPITSQCVGPNCCLENTLGLGGTPCTADPTCSPSVTPQ